ncbi:MFS transporter [Streptomyces flaveolus]
MVGVDSTVVNVALPDIRRGLHFGRTGLPWLLNAYTLAFGGLLLLGGRAGDLLGRRRTLTAGVLLFALSSPPGGLAADGARLLVARAAQGLGAALIAPSTLALITTSFPDGPRRHRALSVYSSMAGVNVPIGLALALALPRFVPETPRHGPVRPAGRADGDGRHDLAGVRVSPGLGGRLERHAGTARLRRGVTVYGTATRHTTGSPGAVLTHGAAHAFAAGALITLAGLLLAATVLTGRRGPAK